MAYYVVQAKLNDRDASLLERKLADDAFVDMQPFGRALTKGLRGLRRLPDGRVAWEEEDYCTPPLRMERDAVLDEYFTELEVERVEEGEGWQRLQEHPRLFTDL